MFKFCGSLLHGTRGFGNQIGHHLGAENYLNFNAEDQFSTIANLHLKSFCNKLRNISLNKSGVIGQNSISSFAIIDISENHEFFYGNEKLNYNSEIKIGYRATW